MTDSAPPSGVSLPSSAAAAGSSSRSGREEHVWRQLSELWLSFKPRMMAICREFDLYPPQVMVLQTLDRPKPMREVAGFLACNSSNLTGITDRLEERDLVRRTSDPDDRRVKLLVLTEGGQKLRGKVMERMEVPPEAFVALDDGQLDQLGDLLETLNRPPADG